jgi:hypothetical protein
VLDKSGIRDACPRGRARVSIGPVTKTSDVHAALEQGALKKGGGGVVDFHVDPGEERLSAATAAKPQDGVRNLSQAAPYRFGLLDASGGSKEITHRWPRSSTFRG